MASHLLACWFHVANLAPESALIQRKTEVELHRSFCKATSPLRLLVLFACASSNGVKLVFSPISARLMTSLPPLVAAEES
eukprot:6385816-Amphidinium_carterae.1